MRKLLRFLSGTIFLLVTVIVLIVVGFRINAWYQESGSATALAPKTGQFVETELGRIHVTVWGEDNPIPIVMTHGMAAWGGLWEETGQYLAENGYRVIAADLPPFGFSQRSERDFSRSRQAARVAALIEALNLQQPLLLGHSYGGGVAVETAMRFPEQLGGLVLVCPVIRLVDHDGAISASEVPLPLRSQTAAEFLVSASITNPLLTGTLTRQFMYRKDALTKRHVAILQRPIHLRGNTENMVLWLRQFVAGDPNAMSRRPKNLSSLAVPVSLIWGEEDTVTPVGLGEQLSDIVDPVAFARMPETGHMPQLERPAEFNAHLLRSLGSLRQAEMQRKLSGKLRDSISQ